jgi:RES domain-containing protein
LNHDDELLAKLSEFESETFGGSVFRATRFHLDPTEFTTTGGRWARPGATPVLYTSLEREGALAEVCFHWSLLNPLPTKAAKVHKLSVSANRCLRLLKGELRTLGVSVDDLGRLPYAGTQEIGSAVAFLEHDGLIVPSARWGCDNLILFQEHHSLQECKLDLEHTEEVDWQEWAKAQGVLK